MAKKSKQKPKPPMVITLELPVEGGMPRTGTMVVKHGELAILHQFSYRTVADIMSAINDGVNHEMVVEADPPVITASATAAIAQTPRPAPAATNDTPDEAAEAVEAAEVDDEPQDSETDQGGDDESSENTGDPLWEEPSTPEAPDTPDTAVPTLVGATEFQQQAMF